nr:hypothetical protein L203_02283 [Cryptococcus depauperatus CBS 7841]
MEKEEKKGTNEPSKDICEMEGIEKQKAENQTIVKEENHMTEEQPNREENGPEDKDDKMALLKAIESIVPTPTPKGPHIQLSTLDINNPLPIDEGGEISLKYWDKLNDYNALFEQRRLIAIPIAESQRAKAEKKARTQLLVSQQEELIRQNFSSSLKIVS